MRFPRPANLISCIRPGIWIKLLPTLIAPSRSAIANVHGGTIENRFIPRPIRIWNACTHKRSTAANAFGICAGIFLTSAGLRQSANDATCSAACRSSGRSRGEPSGGNHRTHAGNCHQAEASQQPDNAASHAADASSRFRSFGPVVPPIAVTVDRTGGYALYFHGSYLVEYQLSELLETRLISL